ncbi:hypothetical protein [Planctomyces sp. SH-PL62]|uniref:hypothetical protein n=1 Tax=Planctomyces sp. SH-PL62 TaxID=1636152 RepID=UPI00078EA74A|nr:hypothetical protein [Planctomyces sp. SH-PL62]AMV39852.1 hypothetical protein VT85_20640 [Planctomyces sp. SH-PL62]
MNTTTIPHPDRKDAARLDVRGWLVLAWVAVWSIAYVQSAIGTRFPWLRSWVLGLF